MSYRSDIRRPRSDVGTIIIYTFLVATGLVMLYSVAAPPEGYTGGLAEVLRAPVGKQAAWLGLSLVAWFLINYAADRKNWIVGAYPIYVLTLVALLLVPLVGKEINGARSWFAVAGFTFQPSELAKFGTCLAMAAYLSQWTGKLDRGRAVAGGLLIWALPAVLIMLQPDAGSALVFSSFLLVMYREGLAGILYVFAFFTALMFVLGVLYEPVALLGGLLGLTVVLFGFSLPSRARWWGGGATVLVTAAALAYRAGYGAYVLAALALLAVLGGSYLLIQQRQRVVGVASLALVWGGLLAFAANYTFNNLLRPHHQARINVWLRPEGMDPRGALYNVLQSKLAIAGGGPTGQGMGQGTMTKYDYVPEQLTDFIFTAVGEEQGFAGTSLVITFYLLLLWRCSVIAERQRLTFARAYAYGFAGIVLIHLLVNVGMTMGLVPVIGIPLPFISKGGSSLLCFTVMMAVMLKLDKHREQV